MFKKIMVPVDLAHQGDLQKALSCATDLAEHYGAEIVYVGVTSSTPGQLAHNPAEFKVKLEAFAAAQAETSGISTSADTIVSHDLRADIDDKLLEASRDLGIDLVVMQSHMPNVLDYVWPSNGGKIAEHAHCSVMLVRD